MTQAPGCELCAASEIVPHVVANSFWSEGQEWTVTYCRDCYTWLRASSRKLPFPWKGVDRVCFFRDHPGFAGRDCDDPAHVVERVLES